MSLAEAAAVLPRRARQAAAVLPADPAADLAALARLAERCEEFSPQVGWETLSQRAVARAARRGPQQPWFGDTPGHLCLDVTGIAPLFGGEDNLAREVIAACREVGYAARVAVADTVGAAWALAEAADPLTVVSPGGLDEVLRLLPVAALRLPVDVLDVLARLGVLTVGQLRQLPRAGLAERFGALIGLRLDQIFGAAAEVVVPHRPPPRFEASCRLDFPTDRRDLLDGLVAELVERITADARARRRGIVRLAGRLDCGPEGAVTFAVGLFRPEDAPRRLLELVRLRLERLDLPGPVERIDLRAEHTAPPEHRQGELFADHEASTEEQIAALLERLTSRFGPQAVVRPELLPDPLPERAFRYVPLVGCGSPAPRPALRKRRAADVSPACEVSDGVSFRPLWLLTPPPRVLVTPAGSDGPPTSFRWEGRTHAVARAWGPERIETGWWRRGLVRRDYYRVETATGHRFWLFRDLTAGTWHLHGSFE
jgi:protein ImuB